MQQDPPPPNAKPLLGLLTELRAQVQLRAETPGPLARLHAYILALLTQLIALIEALPQTESTTAPNTPRPWRRIFRRRTASRSALRTPEALALARILYVVGPRQNRGMCARPAPRPTPELRPPIPLNPAQSAPRRARANAQARSHPLVRYAKSSGNTGRRNFVYGNTRLSEEHGPSVVTVCVSDMILS